ncbi:unnamed protein product, partial [Adineta ricciae]
AANSAATATATTTSTPTSPPHANSQVVSQDQCASSSTNVIIGDSAVDKDESSDTNVNSQTSFGTEVNQALSSSNVLVNRKRTRKALTQIPKGKENCLSFDNDNDNDNHDEHDHDEVIDSVCSQ